MKYLIPCIILFCCSCNHIVFDKDQYEIHPDYFINAYIEENLNKKDDFILLRGNHIAGDKREYDNCISQSGPYFIIQFRDAKAYLTKLDECGGIEKEIDPSKSRELIRNTKKLRDAKLDVLCDKVGGARILVQFKRKRVDRSIGYACYEVSYNEGAYAEDDVNKDFFDYLKKLEEIIDENT